MFDVVGLLKAGLEVAGKVLSRQWGDQTAAESTLRKLAEEAAAKKRESYEKLREAQRAKDPAQVAQYLSAYNGWTAELRRLRERAAAERSER